MSLSESKNSYLFKCVLNNGYLFRVLIDFCKSSRFRKAKIFFTEEAFHCSMYDKSGYILRWKINKTSATHYYCEKSFTKKISISSLFKLLKNVGKRDKLVISVDSEGNELCINPKTNSDGDIQMTNSISFTDFEEDKQNTPKMEDNNDIVVQGLAFKNMIKNIVSISSKTFSFSQTGNSIKGNCMNNAVKSSIILEDKESNISESIRNSVIVSTQNLKNLKKLSPYTNYSKFNIYGDYLRMKIYLGNFCNIIIYVNSSDLLESENQDGNESEED